jgi:hypothetical protein
MPLAEPYQPRQGEVLPYAVTATRGHPKGTGATRRQLVTLECLLYERTQAHGKGVLHHGDAIGGDRQALAIARRLGWVGRAHTISSHTPRDEVARALLNRNWHIVRAGVELFAMPLRSHEELRSGTWAAIRAARSLGKPITIIWPDGTVSLENHPCT